MAEGDHGAFVRALWTELLKPDLYRKAAVVWHRCGPQDLKGFQHVHVDLVEPLLPSDGFTYLLTCIDRYTRWPETIHLRDISAETKAKSFIANWTSHFGVPFFLSPVRGCQFQSHLFSSLKSMLGIQRIKATLYQPSSNGMVERLHRSLKQTNRFHDTKWIE
ncbi:transposon Tf2-9 polyprotein [Nephila pilipes]|uniref:Transposon Tf2-9 polyprotein n=1 Tax=Nephila pilipes TaxID=299642 RepID=A0A8X6Q957_NEPPI|nr:transposon Tf2-9 polyprotein [Nephila pilipes]